MNSTCCQSSGDVHACSTDSLRDQLLSAHLRLTFVVAEVPPETLDLVQHHVQLVADFILGSPHFVVVFQCIRSQLTLLSLL